MLLNHMENHVLVLFVHLKNIKEKNIDMMEMNKTKFCSDKIIRFAKQISPLLSGDLKQRIDEGIICSGIDSGYALLQIYLEYFQHNFLNQFNKDTKNISDLSKFDQNIIELLRKEKIKIDTVEELEEIIEKRLICLNRQINVPFSNKKIIFNTIVLDGGTENQKIIYEGIE